MELSTLTINLITIYILAGSSWATIWLVKGLFNLAVQWETIRSNNPQVPGAVIAVMSVVIIPFTLLAIVILWPLDLLAKVFGDD